MRAIFFGSPAFAVPCLDSLHEVAEVVMVISQPDRPAGRGMSLKPPAVKSRALELGLPVMQPKKVRTQAFAETLRELNADVGVVVAYGRILPLRVLDAPKRRCVNVHASLLPRWRGAAPIQWAIAEGDAETGVTLMQMDEGMDTGPMLATKHTAIGPSDTGGSLSVRLASLGAELLREELTNYVEGKLHPQPQPEEGVTMARILTKDDGRIRWDESAVRIHNRMRAMMPWPGAFTNAPGKKGPRRLKVHHAEVRERLGSHGAPGEVLGLQDDGVVVATSEGTIALLELQEAGRKRLDARTFQAGRALELGTLLGAS